MAGKQNQILAYHFFIEKEKEGTTFSIDEINEAAHWDGATFKSYRGKLLKNIIFKTKEELFYVKGLKGVTETEFLDHLAQTGTLKPKSRQLEDLLNESDNKNLTEIINSGNIDLLKKLLEIALEVDDKQKLIETLIFIFQKTQGEEREKLLIALKNQNLTKSDIDIISGRKEGLELFKKHLFERSDWDEPVWQVFFETNTWIFGYGLDYKFLKILQREARVSDVTVGGEEQVIVDFLVGDKNFTTLIELKKPNTPLFDNDKNRSGSWRLSKDLIFAVSQILEQKAEWQIKSQSKQYNKDREVIKQRTFDPKIILIIGHTEQFSGDNLDQEIKSRTFELFRRNQRNIEILTYDELYYRANFIVNQK
ncbi:MAG TPA: DUF4263 domain-containing protein [Prolixibacteraceae bacterium]|nr:DUF4263 domain-containing protein [Prolixibacteraceae bacterium]